jgi:ubiquinone/menaquinone biosynthesis C-methylase UbiE
MAAHFTNLRSTAFDRAYYEEHVREGLDYLHYSDWQFRYCRWLTDVFAGTIGPGPILDVGCACGNLVQGFHDQGASAVGIDVNQHTIALGRERFPAVRLEVCDAVNLHLFDDCQFRFIHSMQAAEHWPTHLVGPILRELWRVAAWGTFFFCVLDTEEVGHRQGRDLAVEDPTHRTIRPLRWWHEQLTEAGWKLTTEDHRMPLLEHGWSYLRDYDWDWFTACKWEQPG